MKTQPLPIPALLLALNFFLPASAHAGLTPDELAKLNRTRGSYVAVDAMPQVDSADSFTNLIRNVALDETSVLKNNRGRYLISVNRSVTLAEKKNLEKLEAFADACREFHQEGLRRTIFASVGATAQFLDQFEKAALHQDEIVAVFEKVLSQKIRHYPYMDEFAPVFKAHLSLTHPEETLFLERVIKMLIKRVDSARVSSADVRAFVKNLLALLTMSPTLREQLIEHHLTLDDRSGATALMNYPHFQTMTDSLKFVREVGHQLNALSNQDTTQALFEEMQGRFPVLAELAPDQKTEFIRIAQIYSDSEEQSIESISSTFKHMFSKTLNFNQTFFWSLDGRNFHAFSARMGSGSYSGGKARNEYSLSDDLKMIQVTDRNATGPGSMTIDLINKEGRILHFENTELEKKEIVENARFVFFPADKFYPFTLYQSESGTSVVLGMKSVLPAEYDSHSKYDYAVYFGNPQFLAPQKTGVSPCVGGCPIGGVQLDQGDWLTFSDHEGIDAVWSGSEMEKAFADPELDARAAREILWNEAGSLQFYFSHYSRNTPFWQAKKFEWYHQNVQSAGKQDLKKMNVKDLDISSLIPSSNRPVSGNPESPVRLFAE